MFSNDLFVMLVLFIIPAFYFLLEYKTKWKIFGILPPLLWIYLTPVILRGVDVLPAQTEVYGNLKHYLLPFFITLLVMSVDLKSAMKSVRMALPLMAISTLGVIIGGPLAYLAVHSWLDVDAWSGFGALAGSWIGGTANMAAAAAALDTSGEQLGLAILADQVVFFFWLPLLIVSRVYVDKFNKWTSAREIKYDVKDVRTEHTDLPPMLDFMLIGAAGLLNVWLSFGLASILPELPPILSESTWRVLLITTGAIGLSFTPLRFSRLAEPAGTGLLYAFVATMGASASFEGLGQAPVFLIGAFIWIFIHGAFCLGGAKLLKMDLHIVVIASAANIGGAASAPVVAAAHNKALVPVALVMAMIGYVFGNYLSILVGHLCRMIVL